MGNEVDLQVQRTVVLREWILELPGASRHGLCPKNVALLGGRHLKAVQAASPFISVCAARKS